MAKKVAKRKVGRPNKVYTPAQLRDIDGLAKEGHKTGTIAVALGLDEESLKLNLTERMAKKRVEGKIALKKAQLDKALTVKDTTMLVWLGKNDLGQTDRQNINVDGSIVQHIVLGKKNANRS